jgi:hypothetical protein
MGFTETAGRRNRWPADDSYRLKHGRSFCLVFRWDRSFQPVKDF